MRILVCGGRDYAAKDTDEITFMYGELYKYTDGVWKDDLVIIQGGARGADARAKEFAYNHGIHSVEYKADWDKHGKKAGYLRNKHMLEDGRPDLVVAFPGGKGTENMVALATKAGVKTVVYRSTDV